MTIVRFVPDFDPPPPGAPWDLSLADVPFAFVDLEMTGLDVASDRVVEVCIERVSDGKQQDALTTLIDPEERAGGAAHVHGLDAAALAGAPRFASVIPEITRLLDGAVLVAHAAAWDVAFLTAEFRRAGVDRPILHYLDTLTLARRAFAFHSYSLGSLATSLAIDRGQAHRAASDVRVMRELFDRCAAVLAPVSARDLWEVRVGLRRARAAILDACEAAREYGTPVTLIYRPSRRAPEPIQMVLLEICSDLDPPRVIGYQLPSRSRRELRVDRILRIEPGPA